MKTVFLDTNVIIDFFQKREEFYDAAALIINLANEGKIKIIVSSLTFVTAYYILKKIYSKEDLVKCLSGLADLCIISDVSSMNIKNALHSDFKDFEDCVQIKSSVNVKSEVIISRNVKDFVNSPIPVKTPIEFLSEFFGR